jgi:hypothetical protein
MLHHIVLTPTHDLERGRGQRGAHEDFSWALFVVGLVLVGVVINHLWLQTARPEPHWLRPWYVRLSIRLIVVALLIAALLVANPTF